jgi:hypothetical protein
VETTSSKFAPAGYGLGGVTVSSKPDEALKNGFYHVWLQNVNDYSGYVNLIVANNGDDIITQTAYGAWGEVMHRVWYGDKWSEWDIENPPMKLGVEYRTTERWWGHPVYKKIVSVGKLPSATEATVSGVLTGVQDIISYSMTYASSGQAFINNSLVTELGRDESLSAWVKIKTTTNLSGYNAFLTLTYTKMEG